MVMARSVRTARGFTLIELMIALAIAGILAMIGAPAMGSLLARTQDSGIESAMAAGLRGARNAAVMRTARVLVCPSADGRHCGPGADWQHGWIVAQDADHDDQPDAGKSILDVEAAVPTGTRVVSSGGRRRINFQPSGSAGGSNATFTICHARAHDGQAVIVANSGRVRVARADAAHLQACLAGMP
jgi:type IV fimbrial biogenesis protein FimT